MCDALGRKPPSITIPPLPLFERILPLYFKEVIVSGRRLREELGFQPEFALLDGWRETVAGLRSRPEL